MGVSANKALDKRRKVWYNPETNDYAVFNFQKKDIERRPFYGRDSDWRDFD
jgi:hypothetical protein